MSLKRQKTTLEERVTISEQAQAGRSSREIAEAMGCAVATVRKWRQRYRRAGRAGLSSVMGRPVQGALASVSAEMRAALLELRDKHPGWGAQTLRLEISKDERFVAMKTPSRGRIAAYLKEQKRVRKYERHEELASAPSQSVQRPHQEWEMDTQGITQVAGIGKASFINVLDVFSHLSIDSHACPHVSHPKTEAYQQVLRRAFIRYGLPEQISLDHDSVFFDNESASPFPSRIHLWLIGLGVGVRFIDKRPPLEHARIERHHQTIAGQAFEGQNFADVPALQSSLQARILFLNLEYPTRALRAQTPLQAFPDARHSGRPYSLEDEEQILDLQPIYAYLQTGRWFRQISTNGTCSLGGHSYNLSTQFAERPVQITFDAPSHSLIFQPEKSAASLQFDIQGLTKFVLMGNAFALPGYVPLQLALPFAHPDTTL